MIINNLSGGLGNQLFQIATGFSQAKRVNTKFAINYNIGLGSGQGFHHKKYKFNLYKNIPETERVNLRPYREPYFSFCPILRLDNICLIGYFQSRKYFMGFENEVKKLFSFPKMECDRVQKKFEKIKKKKVGIHVRLGDYFHEKNKDVFFKINYPEYIKKAKEIFGDDYEYLIFSDDQILLRKSLDINSYIDLNNDSEIEDLYSLSQCDAIVMSNSSFSWWGAFLGKEKEKVVCPKKWFGLKGPKDEHDIYEDYWIKI